MVSSYLQLLERRYRGNLDQDADTYIGFAVEGSERMRGLINDLLLYSRIAARGKPLEATDCGAALDSALANLQVAIRDSGAVITHDGLPTARADSSQLVQLFQNLVGNAIKFRGERPPRIRVLAERSEDDWVISVCDSGIGIAPEYHERVFKIFQRLHSREEYAGTGIGLAVCRRIVERHGGRIWVGSEPGQGARFSFSIPAIIEEKSDGRPQSGQTDRDTAGGGQPRRREAHAGRAAGG